MFFNCKFRTNLGELQIYKFLTPNYFFFNFKYIIYLIAILAPLFLSLKVKENILVKAQISDGVVHSNFS